MKLPTLRIHYKIVIPFTLLVIVATLVTSFISVTLISETLERRFRRQIEDASEVLAQSDFALSRSILERLKLIVDADIITYKKDGEVLAGTLGTEADSELLDLVRSPQVIEQIFTQGQALVMRDARHRGRPYKFAYRPLRYPPDTVIAFVAETSDIVAAQNAVARNIAILAVVLIVVMALVSQMIARSITSPVERLVEHTKSLASGDLTKRATVQSNDEIGRLAEAFNDMTEQLRQSEERVLRSEKLAVTGQLAARVAHDVRNPLSSIKMQAQLLRNKLKPSEANAASLQAILREVDRVEWVVQGLLDLARPEELRLEAGQVNEVLEEALEVTGAQLQHGKITVVKKIEPHLPPVKLDADRLKQALLNVILNAAEAMPRGGTLVATTRINQGGLAVTIEICDDGVGMDPKTQHKLFDPFFTTKREGVGLGLVNTKSIVERHGGTIHLVPRNGKGTRVSITLPRVGVADSAERTEEPVQKAGGSTDG